MRNRRWLLLTVVALASTNDPSPAAASCRSNSPPKIYSGRQVLKVDSGVAFMSPKLAVDADGAPNAYRVDGKGLSHTCDGLVGIVGGKRITRKVDRNNWQAICNEAFGKAQATGDYRNVDIFGFLADEKGRPMVQREGDPLPDQAYITTTSVVVPGQPEQTQRRYVNAVEIPYVVLSTSFTKDFKVSGADVVVAYRPKTGRYAFGVYGDGGGLGEASVRMHQDLGSDPLLDRGGVMRAKKEITDPILTIVFPGAHTTPTLDAAAWRRQIQEVGTKALEAWGGVERLKACAKM